MEGSFLAWSLLAGIAASGLLLAGAAAVVSYRVLSRRDAAKSNAAAFAGFGAAVLVFFLWLLLARYGLILFLTARLGGF